MAVEHTLGAVILAALVVYALSGGADYGGGMWDLLASGPSARRQRAAIEHAIGPIWEANHVWLILVIVVLFTAFPSAFAAIMTALHIPMTAILIGIVLRGSAFVFRSTTLKTTPSTDAGARCSARRASSRHSFSVCVWAPWLRAESMSSMDGCRVASSPAGHGRSPSPAGSSPSASLRSWPPPI